MARYKITLTYDGTLYGGWQIQPNTVSIQSLLEQALSMICRKPTAIVGSGRTDAGVHALAQVAHFEGKNIQEEQLRYTLNSVLPKDIRILEIEKTVEDFHAQYSATGKIYHYHLYLDPILNPFTRLYSWKVPLAKVNRSLLQEGASLFLGTKDFSALANEAHKGAAAKNGIRTIKRLDLVEEPGGIRLEFEANGFLYKMVRNITGTLIDLCAGHLQLEDIEALFSSKDRKKAGRTAPPHGLFLVKVHYTENY